MSEQGFAHQDNLNFS